MLKHTIAAIVVVTMAFPARAEPLPDVGKPLCHHLGLFSAKRFGCAQQVASSISKHRKAERLEAEAKEMIERAARLRTEADQHAAAYRRDYAK